MKATVDRVSHRGRVGVKVLWRRLQTSQEAERAGRAEGRVAEGRHHDDDEDGHENGELKDCFSAWKTKLRSDASSDGFVFWGNSNQQTNKKVIITLSMRARTHAHMHARTHAHTHTHTRTHARKQPRALAHAHTRSPIRLLS